MPLAAQPAGIYAYTGTAQVAAACRIAGVAVDAVDGDTCIELAAFVVLHFVDTALEGRIILAETAVISTVGTQFAPVVTGPDAALSRFFITAQLAHAFHQVVAFDTPHTAHCHLRVAGCFNTFSRKGSFSSSNTGYLYFIILNFYISRTIILVQYAVQCGCAAGEIT